MSARVTPAAPALADDTRSRLIESAGPVFAESGFQGATVREICSRAGVNIALVNYHFGDKLELYTEVLRLSIGAPTTLIQAALNAGGESGAAPAEIIRQTVHAMLQKILSADRPAWHFRLLAHELAHPTPAISIVINETARPVYDGIRAAVAAIIGLPPDHDDTRFAAHSIISQVVHYSHGRNMIAQLWPELAMTPARIAQISEHITAFSLAGLEHMKTKSRNPPPLQKASLKNSPKNVLKKKTRGSR